MNPVEKNPSIGLGLFNRLGPMYKELIINDAGFETRVALLEDGVLAELYVERPGETDLVGNVYKGRVMRVLPGMQAAFVDIGLSQAAFIYVDDVVAGFPVHESQQQWLDQAIQEEGEEGKPEENGEGEDAEEQAEPTRRPPIEEMLREGQEILVQIAKSPIGKKGARVTSRVSIPGRFLVLMPTTAHIGVSRRIEDAEERTRLKEGIQKLRREPYGYIVRTVSQGMDLEKLMQELEFLTRLWNRIQERYWKAAAPSVLYKELSASLKAVRDLFTQEVDRLVVDSESGHREILDFIEPLMPNLADAVVRHQDLEPIFDAYHLEGEISRLARKKVWLKSGGYIVIEDTEALTSIDVNTGRFVGKEDLAETILKTNLEAVKEIAYQLRLRDIGGIIVIDFIDMEKMEDREKVHQALVTALKRDRSTTNVLPMSDLGLIEMTRKRTKENLNRMLSEPCFYCEGEGRILSKKSICHNIYREILRHAADMTAPRISLKVHPDVAQFLLEEENTTVMALESSIAAEILIQADSRLHMEMFDILELTLDRGKRP